MTEKELEVLRAIDAFIKQNKYSPTVREIGRQVGLSSSSTVHSYFSKLQEKGYIEKQSALSRSLILTDEGRKAVEDHGRY